MSTVITIGYSPCPNDTFIFYALIHGKVRVPGVEFRERLDDVETLNHMALKGTLDVTKISYHAFGQLRDQYALLRSGSALGRGCGPLVVSRPGTELSVLNQVRVAVPGRLTTALLLLRLYDPSIRNILVLPFDRIVNAVAGGEAETGLIIHESRFTYQQRRLVRLLDLGEWWERHTCLPIPLGGILGKRSLGRDLLLGIEAGIRNSLQYALANVAEVMKYCRRYSQEMDEQVMKKHIQLYVNDFSLDLGEAGIGAVRRLLREAEERNIFPGSGLALLAEDA
jgi:1,4-dihydroxy-6-naphthoate synthase